MHFELKNAHHAHNAHKNNKVDISDEIPSRINTKFLKSKKFI